MLKKYYLGGFFWTPIRLDLLVYGNPLKVLPSNKKEIDEKNKKTGDASSFKLFHSFLLKCQSVTSNQTWNPLDSPFHCT